MRRRVRYVALWTVAVAVGAAGLATVPLVREDRSVVLDAADGASSRPTVAPDSAPAEAVWRSALFRATRTPATERYDASDPLQPPERDLERPAWHLSGVLKGDVSLAVFEEQPGQQNATYIVTVGDEVDGYVVVAVGGDTAVIESGGVRWTFTVEPPWQ